MLKISHKIRTTLSLAFIVFYMISCSDSLPTFPDGHHINMYIDAEVTECWIELQIEDLQKFVPYIVSRDDQIIYKNWLTESRLLLHDTNLQPGQTYCYKAYATKGEVASDSATVFATTMDSTVSRFNISAIPEPDAQLTHCWIWHPESYWIIGEYYPIDSTGSKMKMHNILSYENGTWDYIEVLSEVPWWPSPTSLAEFTGFWAFDKSDVWFANYDIQYWTGGIAKTVYDGNQRHALFGFDDKEVFAAGRKGLIQRFVNNEVETINLNDRYYISDLWGDNEENLELTVFDAENIKPLLVFMKDDNHEILPYDCPDNPETLWFKNRDKIFLGGKNVYTLNYGVQLNEHILGNITYITKLRGTDLNNIFAITWCGKVFHFNGVQWKFIYQVPAMLNDIQVTDELVLIVGRGTFSSIIIKVLYED